MSLALQVFDQSNEQTENLTVDEKLNDNRHYHNIP